MESVLAALVKVAAVELTKLFESRCPTSAVDDQLGRAKDGKENGTAESLSTEDSKRSIGVQVDEDISPQLQLSGMCVFLGVFKYRDFLFGSIAGLHGQMHEGDIVQRLDSLVDFLRILTTLFRQQHRLAEFIMQSGYLECDA